MLQYTCVVPLGGLISSLPAGSCSDNLLCTEDEIAGFITSLEANKACGLDNISVHVLKCTLASTSVVSPLTRLLMFPFKQFVFLIVGNFL